MTHSSTDLFKQHGGRAVLISLLPKYAEKIASGTKRIEFRRTWTAEPVAVLTLYATAPVSRVIGIAHVRRVVEASPTALWRYAQQYGGGISRRDLYAYMSGKKTGFALLLGPVELFDPPVDPKHATKSFRPPQSFRFLLPAEFQQLTRGQRGSRKEAYE